MSSIKKRSTDRPATRGQSIDAMCKECIYDPGASGTWREQTGACTSIACPLWTFRPLPAHAPEWLKHRKAKRLPNGFITPKTDTILAMIRSDTPEGSQNPQNCNSVELESDSAA